MRILHIHSGNLYGGIERYLVTLARCSQVCPEMESEFALSFPGRLSQELKTHGAVVHDLGAVQTRYPWRVIQGRRTLSGLLQRGKYDVAMCHGAWAQAIFGPAVLRAQTPLVFYLHSATSGRHWVERWANRVSPTGIICNSQFTKDSLDGRYQAAHREVLHLPLEPSLGDAGQQRSAIRAALQTPADALAIIQVSRMEAGKGHSLHLEALAALAQRKDWVLWLVGGVQRPSEARYLAELKQKAQALGIAERVRFAGERNDVAALLAAADIFCQPNVGPESFGLTFIEAMYAGLPIITTAIGGALEIVDASTGILVPPNSAAELSAALQELLSDGDARRRLASAGPCRARQLCDPQRQLARLRDILESIAHRTSRAPLWVKLASKVIPHMPRGRYRAVSLLSRRSNARFLTRMPAHLGGYTFTCDLRDAISREVCFTGHYERVETAIVRQVLRPGMVFIDAGANWGYFSLFAASLVGAEGRVFSLEPDPRMFAALQTNVVGNSLKHVTLLQVAAAETAGMCVLSGFEETSGNFGITRISNGNGAQGDRPRFEAPTKSLDSLVQDFGLKQVDLVKIDVEGAEAGVIAGMKWGLEQKLYRAILLELHPGYLQEQGANVSAVVSPLLRAGYTGWSIDHSMAALRTSLYSRKLNVAQFVSPFKKEDSPPDPWPHTFWTFGPDPLNVSSSYTA